MIPFVIPRRLVIWAFVLFVIGSSLGTCIAGRILQKEARTIKVECNGKTFHLRPGQSITCQRLSSE